MPRSAGSFDFRHGGNIYVYPLMAQAKMGEALAAVSLTSFFTRAGVPVHATQSRFVTWETLRQENVIFLGHADSNQWIEPVLKSAPFTLAPTDQRNRARILNHQPRPGEQPNYTPTLPDANKSYALVSMLPGMDGSHEILVIGGLDTSSTTAAAEFLMRPEQVRELLRRLSALPAITKVHGISKPFSKPTSGIPWRLRLSRCVTSAVTFA
jgi:hypothetical protein